MLKRASPVQLLFAAVRHGAGAGLTHGIDFTSFFVAASPECCTPEIAANKNRNSHLAAVDNENGQR
jgi:hypothetical protein